MRKFVFAFMFVALLGVGVVGAQDVQPAQPQIDILSNLLLVVAIAVPALLAGYGLRDVLMRRDVNEALEKAYASIPESVHKETVSQIAKMAQENRDAVLEIVRRYNGTLADALQQLSWVLDVAEDVTDGEIEADEAKG